MNMNAAQSILESLPNDWQQATLVGRLDFGQGPTPVVIRKGRVTDVSATAPTVSGLLQKWGQDVSGNDLGELKDLDIKTSWSDPEASPRLLAPVDLQVIKASGVTFATSAVERVIEERARGDANKAHEIRNLLQDKIGTEIRAVVPGSAEAEALKEVLIAEGLWSQYLEVAIGPYAEIFTKGPALSSMGWGDYIGVRSDSDWNNPEPEVAIVCDGQGKPVGATLGNDVNLRDIEGRSALLLGKAKDNNASCSLGPFIRIFDDTFSMDDIRKALVKLEVTGSDGFRMEGESSMAEISRDPLELVGQALSEHQYPDGFVIFLGTLFAPTQDRGIEGRGFTHQVGDLVHISTEKLGVLTNQVTTSADAPPWTFGLGSLMANLSSRGLLGNS
jgi:fumarylacetoacetate (FAA) hydrolase family protein